MGNDAVLEELAVAGICPARAARASRGCRWPGGGIEEGDLVVSPAAALLPAAAR